MKNLLSEEIETYRRLSNYSTKLTLTENINTLLEAGRFGPNFATNVRGVESAFAKELELVMQDLNITAMDAGRVTKLLEMDAKSFTSEYRKALQADIKAGIPKGTLGPITKELAKVDYLKRVAKDIQLKSAGRNTPLSVAEVEAIMKGAKADSILLRDTNVLKFNSKVPKPKPEDINAGEEAIRIDPSLKKLDWKSLTKKGAILALSAGALYYIYKLTHEDEPPISVPVPVPVPPVPVPPVPNPSQYRSCPDTFPIGQFCKNGTIKKVQGCLGITADGLFGPKTQAALEAKGVDGTSITQQTVDKVCNNTALVDTDTEDVDGQDPNTI
jgi:hypothetical protein